MKTLNEVIDQLTECHTNWARWSENSDIVDRSAVADALHYLKHLQEYYNMSREHHEPNPALTWDELRQMEGKPVWVEYNFHLRDKEIRDKSKRWCIIGKFKPWNDTEITITENGFVLSKREQNCWKAYRKERI